MAGHQAAKDAAVRHSRNSSSIYLESGHRESFRGCVESGYLLYSLTKARARRKNRARAGLRARLKFGRYSSTKRAANAWWEAWRRRLVAYKYSVFVMSPWRKSCHRSHKAHKCL